MKIARNCFSRSNLKWALVLFCLMTTAAYAESPRWVRAISSQGSGNSCDPAQCDDTSYAIKVGPDNQQYVTGRFSGTATFGGTTLVSAGGLDFFLAKYGRFGELLWIVQAGGPGDDGGTSLDFDGAGSIYVTGGFTSTAIFGSTNGATQTVTGTGSTIFLAKYRPSGALVWVQTGVVPLDETNGGNGVVVDPAASTVYITAVSQGDVTFSSADGTLNTVPGVGTWHMVLVKYDTSGNFKWGETNAAEPNSIPYAVAVDAKDNVYVTGWLEDTTTFSSTDGNAITVTGFSPAQTTGDYPDDAFLVKYDANGNAKWVNHIGGHVARTSAVAVSPDGEVSIAGLIGNINFGSAGEAETIATSQPPGTNINLGGGDFTNPYNSDTFIATYDAAGVLRRALRKGDSNQEAATGIAYDAVGDLYVAGIFQDTKYPQNLFVLKFSENTLLWEKVAENAGVCITDNNVLTPSVSVGPAGDIFVTGVYQGTATFGDITLVGTGSSDIYVAELAPE
jgi:hypothetical protein